MGASTALLEEQTVRGGCLSAVGFAQYPMFTAAEDRGVLKARNETKRLNAKGN